MKKYSIKKLVLQEICLLIPLILYAIYKNGYLIYQKGLINIVEIFKPIYLVLIGVVVKVIIDLIKERKIKIDYNLLYVILISMIMPYNISIILYTISFTCLYILSLFLDKFIKLNKVCFIYLIIVLLNLLFNTFTFKNILEESVIYNFSFLNILFGRSVGGLCSTSILFSLIAFTILTNNFYYKKDIPFMINIVYLLFSFIYFIITKNSNILLNSELIFASVFIASLPEYSPFGRKGQIIFGSIIGVLSFILSLLFNAIISVYIVIFILSLVGNHKSLKNNVQG